MIAVTAIPALQDNYVWLLQGKSRQVVVVDPGEAEPVIDHLDSARLELAAILVTHHHWDHTDGIADLVARRDVPVFAPGADSIRGATEPLDADETFQAPGIDCEFQALATPGHTRGQVAYYADGMVFTGDTLFSAGCGRLFEGTAEEMWGSLERLRHLPPDTRVYCGHEYTQRNLRFAAEVEPDNGAIAEHQRRARRRLAGGQPTLPSTIGQELTFNPFLRTECDTVRAGIARNRNDNVDDPVAVFAALRSWKDDF